MRIQLYAAFFGKDSNCIMGPVLEKEIISKFASKIQMLLYVTFDQDILMQKKNLKMLKIDKLGTSSEF